MLAANPQFRPRKAAPKRREIPFLVNGGHAIAFDGDTIAVALLSLGSRIRMADFDATARAGFCLMGMCQDCWVALSTGERVRACTTPLRAGMDIVVGGMVASDD